MISIALSEASVEAYHVASVRRSKPSKGTYFAFVISLGISTNVCFKHISIRESIVRHLSSQYQKMHHIAQVNSNLLMKRHSQY